MGGEIKVASVVNEGTTFTMQVKIGVANRDYKEEDAQSMMHMTQVRDKNDFGNINDSLAFLQTNAIKGRQGRRQSVPMNIMPIDFLHQQ